MASREPQLNRSDSDQSRLAVLIDADNAQPSVIDGLLAEVARVGVASVKRIDGDWTSPSHTQWKKSLLKHSIQPVQQFAYTSGKNATDSALIIDAMDLLHAGNVDGFCLVSSDSDFTRLASRIREDGLVVYGFGERKTPKPFVAACDTFIYVENLTEAELRRVRSRKGNPILFLDELVAFFADKAGLYIEYEMKTDPTRYPQAQIEGIESQCENDILEIKSPEHDGEVMGVVEIVGSVNTPSLGSYRYDFSTMGEPKWQTIAAGSGVRIDENLGNWYTSDLAPGPYMLRLVALDNDGNETSTCVIVVNVKADE